MDTPRNRRGHDPSLAVRVFELVRPMMYSKLAWGDGWS